MVLNDTLADSLSHINSFEKLGRNELVLDNNSKIIRKVLDVLKENGYLSEYEVIEDGKGGKIKVNLLNRINKCGVIKPRYQVKKTDFEKFEKRYLLARGFGIMIVSTSKGIMIVDNAKKLSVGGKLLAYCY